MADPGRLLAFLDESLDYFLAKSEGVSRDRYFADRDVRSILDKTINDIILCIVDLWRLEVLDLTEKRLRTAARSWPNWNCAARRSVPLTVR